MSRTPSTIAAGIAAFAALAPAAVAMPVDGPITSSQIKTSSLSGLTTSQRQDLRSPDARDVGTRDAGTRTRLVMGHHALPPVFPTANVDLPPAHQPRVLGADASNGFDVTDAALGAGGAFAAVVIATAGGVALRRRTARGLAA
jgi:hypothetical protein